MSIVEGGSRAMHDLATFDTILSQGRPFGDSTYIHEQMWRSFERRIETIGGHRDVARRLLDGLRQADANRRYRLLGDPVVRAAIQQALGQIVTGTPATLSPDACDEVFRATLRYLAGGGSDAPSASGSQRVRHLGAAARTAWIWSPERHPDDAFGQAFSTLIQAEYGESLCAPSAADITLLQQATQLLHELLPALAHGALSHAHIVGVFPGTGTWEKVASSSQFRLTGAIFLNRTTFNNPWWLAEHLLHESLHQKLYDFRHAHSLLTRDDPNAPNLPADAPKIVSLWNTPVWIPRTHGTRTEPSLPSTYTFIWRFSARSLIDGRRN